MNNLRIKMGEDGLHIWGLIWLLLMFLNSWYWARSFMSAFILCWTRAYWDRKNSTGWIKAVKKLVRVYSVPLTQSCRQHLSNPVPSLWWAPGSPTANQTWFWRPPHHQSLTVLVWFSFSFTTSLPLIYLINHSERVLTINKLLWSGWLEAPSKW